MPSHHTKFGLLIAVILLAGAVSPAHAVPAKCRAAIVKHAGVFLRAKTKALSSCEAGVVNGRRSPDTNCHLDPDVIAAIAKANLKARAGVAKACGGKNKRCDPLDVGADADDALAALGFPATCPNIGAAACTNAIADCDDLTECLGCIGSAAADEVVTLAYGQLLLPSVNKDLRRCQAAIGKSAGTFVAAKSKALARCWTAVSLGKILGPCPDPRAAAAITKAEAKKIAAICKVCGAGGDKRPADGQCDAFETAFSPLGQIGFPATCPAVTVPGGATCARLIATLDDLIACLDCVAEFAVDCADRSAVPGFLPYPLECVALPAPTPSATPTAAGTPTASAPNTTATPTSSTVASVTSTPTATISTTPESTASSVATATPTGVPSPTGTVPSSPTAILTATSGVTPTATASPVPTATATPKAIGSPCTSSPECETNQCVDGFCCVNACAGACQRCNRPGNLGICTGCANDHGMTMCVADACVPDCDDGWASCDGDPDDGCETSIRTLTNCGSCGTACNLPDAIESCATGSCQITSCNAGFAHCDASQVNGCETQNSGHVSACPGQFLGTVSGDTADSLPDEHGRRGEFFSIFVSEDDPTPFATEALGLTVRLTSPNNVDYDLYAYCDTCGSVATSSMNGQGIVDQVQLRWNDVQGQDDGRTIVIEVRHFDGGSCTNWTLEIIGDSPGMSNTCS